MTRAIVLDYSPRPWQRACHLMRARFRVLALHRRAGKTELGMMSLVHDCLRSTLPLPGYAYVAPFRNQAKAITWARLKQRLRPLEVAGAVAYNESDLTVTFAHNGAVLRLAGADNPDSLRGLRLDGCVIDEVAQIAPDVWEEVVRPALSDREGWAMFIGTPNGVNLFSELFVRAADRPQWAAARYTVYDTDTLRSAEIERLKEDMTPAAFAREMLCDFAAAGDDQVLPLADVEEAARRSYGEGDTRDAPLVMGVDPARFGGDRSVAIMRRGLVAMQPSVWTGIDNMALAAKVGDLIERHEPDAVFVDSGAGAGVIDRLRQLGHDVVEVPFGGAAIVPTQFINRRSEMWWRMREWVLSGGAIPPDLSLKSQLATPTYKFDAQGRRALESKDEIKKRLHGGGSPDSADALALTFAAYVAKRLPREIERAIRSRPKAEHDPYAETGR
jgi:hypothetical protein